MPSFDRNFSIGNLITIAVLVVGMAITYGQIDVRLSRMEEDNKDMKQEIRILRTELIASKIEIAGLSAQLSARRLRE